MIAGGLDGILIILISEPLYSPICLCELRKLASLCYVWTKKTNRGTSLNLCYSWFYSLTEIGYVGRKKKTKKKDRFIYVFTRPTFQ